MLLEIKGILVLHVFLLRLWTGSQQLRNIFNFTFFLLPAVYNGTVKIANYHFALHTATLTLI